MRLVCFREGGRFFLLEFVAPATKFDSVARELSNAVAAADFAFSPEDSAVVDRERAAVDMSDPESLLAGVRTPRGDRRVRRGGGPPLRPAHAPLPGFASPDHSARTARGSPPTAWSSATPTGRGSASGTWTRGRSRWPCLTSISPPEDFGVMAGIMDLAYLFGPKFGEMLADEGARGDLLGSSAAGRGAERRGQDRDGARGRDRREARLGGRGGLPKSGHRMLVRLILDGDVAVMLIVVAPPGGAAADIRRIRPPALRGGEPAVRLVRPREQVTLGP